MYLRKFKLAAVFLLPSIMLFGCAPVQKPGGGKEISADYVSNSQQIAEVDEAAQLAVNSFGVKLLQQVKPQERGVLLSPVSVLSALGMTANGAAGDTLAELEAAFGLDAASLNRMYYALAFSRPDEECKVHSANSIWLHDDESLQVLPQFLQTNADFYKAQVYRAPFDINTVRKINAWVSQNTAKMIDGIISELPKDSMLCLLNALAFDAKWQDPYEDYQLRDGDFTNALGECKQTKMMFGEEHTYLANEQAQGFLKPYRGGRYAFMGLLPNEGIDIADFVQGLSGDALHKLLLGASYEEVLTAVPKFSADYTAELGAALQSMGIKTAFDADKADFSLLGSYNDYNLYIGEVLHKTTITVDTQGTKAGAATAVMMNAGSAPPLQEPKQVYLDRPFVYGIIDLQNNVPLFLGYLTDV